jgi:polyferredoxin
MINRLWKRAERLLRWSAGAALVGLLLMVWSFHDSRPISLVVFMVVGQGLGTLSFVLYLAVVVVDAFREDLGVGRATPGGPPEDPGQPGGGKP